MRHRGPDDSGYFSAPGVALGHRRLEVIDIEGGVQPMTDTETGLTIVYNGEVYNFKELRYRLEKKGHVFYTESDTEVVLKSYLEWSNGCVEHFNGMFAIAIWDPKRSELFLARDRMGQKPLFFAHNEHFFLFASEPKALLTYPDMRCGLNVEALQGYLLCEYVPAPLSIFDGINKLSPACRATLDIKSWKLSSQKYWRLPLAIDHRYEDTPLDYAKGRIIELLESAVEKRLISDVPLGVFLSGGLDSSILTALMCRHRKPSTVDTFSIGFKDPSFDESSHARDMARHLGTRHHEKILEPSTVMELLPRITEIMDEPFGDASIVPTHLLSDFARREVAVVLGGDGGDELFAGYPTFQAERMARWFYDSRAKPIKRALKFIAGKMPVSTKNISLDFKIKQFLKGADYSCPDRHSIWLGSFSPDEIQGLLHPEIKNSIAPDSALEMIRDEVAGDLPADLDDALFSYYCRYYLAEDILVKVDRASMAVGLEARAPFLDPELVEFASRLPSRLRMHGLTTKYVLKKAVEDIIPKQIINRPKKGFGIPVARWIKNQLRPLMEHLLNTDRLRKQAIFHPPAVKKLMEEHLRGKKDNRKPLWTLMAFQLWWDSYGPEKC